MSINLHILAVQLTLHSFWDFHLSLQSLRSLQSDLIWVLELELKAVLQAGSPAEVNRLLSLLEIPMSTSNSSLSSTCESGSGSTCSACWAVASLEIAALIIRDAFSMSVTSDEGSGVLLSMTAWAEVWLKLAKGVAAASSDSAGNWKSMSRPRIVCWRS